MTSYETYLAVKPLSVNEAWQGRRFKTDKYEAYERLVYYMLPAGKLPEPPYKIYYEFGFSNERCDYDNPCKPLGDILQKKYHFDDSEIYEAHIVKKIVKRGKEYIKIKIEHLDLGEG